MEDSQPLLESPAPAIDPPQSEAKGMTHKWMWIAGAILLIAALGVGIYFLFQAAPGVTAQVRDVFIIVLALEFLVIGVSLVVLIIQLASLINLLENEVKPILKSTTETVNTLKGTTDFLSENLVDPVIKLNGTLAGLKKLLDLIKIAR
jgi:membrane protein implicated in regulation of membrane protease activity